MEGSARSGGKPRGETMKALDVVAMSADRSGWSGGARGTALLHEGPDMTLKDLLIDELKDLYDAEQQLTNALPALAAASQSDGLRSVFESHLEETRNQVKRLEDIFGLLGVRAERQRCQAIGGLIEEAARKVADPTLDGALKDAALIAEAQKAEHYEMAGYGTAAAWARTLGLMEIATSLEQTLEEEKAADTALNDLALEEINISAQHEGETL
jgi:ferritin-like metal-binding protein YciE